MATALASSEGNPAPPVNTAVESPATQPSQWDMDKWYRVTNHSKKSIDFTDAITGVLVSLKPGTARAVAGSELRRAKFDETLVDIRELEYLPTKEYSISNTTSQRVRIKSYNFWGKGLYIDALGSYKVSGKTLLGLDYLEQENKGLIQIDESDRWDAKKWYRVRNRSPKDAKKLTRPGSTVDSVTINANTARAILGSELRKFDQAIIDKWQAENELIITQLDYEPDMEYSIANLTSKRITISHNAFLDRGLFVPGFGSRNVSGTTLLELNYVPWESQGLIEVRPLKEGIKSTAVESLISLLSVFLFFFLVIGIPLAWKGFISWSVFGIITFLTIAAGVILFYFAGRRNPEFVENVRSWIKLMPGIALIVGTGVGLPILIIYFYGDGPNILTSNRFGLDSLGRFLQTGFIAIAAMLPAFLFYLFGRQQVAKQRENFYREAMVLDPNVWSESEAKNKYDPLLNTVFDTGNSPFSIILLVLSTALLVMGWIIALSPIGRVPLTEVNNLLYFFTPDKSPFTLGFLGAYFFTINMIYRRYVRADLTPKTYAYITMRLLTTVVLVWAVSILPQFQEGSIMETGLSLVAFTIGIFPESALTLIQDYVNKTTAKSRGQENVAQYSLTKLEGINLYDQARLMEEGIENIENLAHHNLMELIVRTRIPTPRLVDMFDQAILYLHLGPEIDENGDKGTEQANQTLNKNLRSFLKDLGIRTATDLINCQDEIAKYKDDAEHTATVKRLKIMIASLQDDEWLNYIESWRENSSTEKKVDPIDNPYKFYFRVTKTKDPTLVKPEDGTKPTQADSSSATRPGSSIQGTGGSSHEPSQAGDASPEISEPIVQDNGEPQSDPGQQASDPSDVTGTNTAQGAMAGAAG